MIIRTKGQYLEFADSAELAVAAQLNIDSAGVAQQVEQLICNQQVAGSSPIASSGYKVFVTGGVPEWLKGADCKSAGEAFGGSNPPPSTSYSIL